MQTNFLEIGSPQHIAMRFMAPTVIKNHPLLLTKMQNKCFYFPTLNNSRILTSMTQYLIKKKPTDASKNNYLFCRCGRWCYITKNGKLKNSPGYH